MDNKLKVLKMIANKFNRENIVWALGASALLYFKGIVDNFNDLDIMVLDKDIYKVKNIMDDLGSIYPPKSKGAFNSKYFYQYNIEGVNIDIIAGFVIIKDDIEYDCTFDANQINEIITLDKERIPLHSIECWYNYYQLMNRIDKIELLETCKRRKNDFTLHE